MIGAIRRKKDADRQPDFGLDRFPFRTRRSAEQVTIEAAGLAKPEKMGRCALGISHAQPTFVHLKPQPYFSAFLTALRAAIPKHPAQFGKAPRLTNDHAVQGDNLRTQNRGQD